MFCYTFDAVRLVLDSFLLQFMKENNFMAILNSTYVIDVTLFIFVCFVYILNAALTCPKIQP